MFKKLNPIMAELIGMHVGDGTLYKTKNCIVWELRGGLNEKDYYLYHVKKLLETLFEDLDFKPKFRSGGKNGCFGIQTSKKELSTFFLEFGFKTGRKTHTVRIPHYIKESNEDVQHAFIRGLFDTDGCLRFDKNHGKLHKYPKIEFSSASQKLILDLSEMLNTLGFMNHIWKDKNHGKLCVPGTKMLEKWITHVKPKNSKHLNRYYIFQKMGCLDPNATVAQPGT